ncbi:hypothetical protein LCGC14_1321570 [marine sediment metagenome]|uniref:Uncharacterized protein n=1 Tax=marine sediment metagenome TaxID=412755 RepID=A0A0F9N025_9ZZZZ
MTNEFLPKIKKLKEDWKAKTEKDLTDEAIIAMIDEQLQKSIKTSDEQPSPDEKDDLRTDDVEVDENDEIEQNSESQVKKKLEELDNYIADKKKEIDKIVKQIKRKDPPAGDISDEATTISTEIKKNWFEVDV